MVYNMNIEAIIGFITCFIILFNIKQGKGDFGKLKQFVVEEYIT